MRRIPSLSRTVKDLPESCYVCPRYKNPCWACLNILKHPEKCLEVIYGSSEDTMIYKGDEENG